MSTRLKAILQALFVTFIWSTSWVLIKIGLKDVPPLVFAGLRYGLAALCLLVLLAFSPERKLIKDIPAGTWLKIFLLGLFYYALTQGSQFLGLNYLPAVTVNLILGASTIVVALLGTYIIHERLSLLQWVGVLLVPLGAYFYFFPIQFEPGQWIGLVICFGGMFSGAIGAIILREMNRGDYLPPLTLTTLAVTVGSIIMLGGGFILEGIPTITLTTWLIIIWMAIVNTAIAFTLWAQSNRILTAVESSSINNTLMIQVPILAVLFLGEEISTRQLLGMVFVAIGVVLVQLFRSNSLNPVLPQGTKPDLKTE